MTLTTPEVAEVLGITPAGVRQLVCRGKLAPVRGAQRPLRFRWLEVERLRAARMTPAQRTRLDELAARFLTS